MNFNKSLVYFTFGFVFSITAPSQSLLMLSARLDFLFYLTILRLVRKKTMHNLIFNLNKHCKKCLPLVLGIDPSNIQCLFTV